MSVLISIDDLSLEFGDQTILRHASLTLESHERVCLIGRNGVGKSTLFKLIMKTQQADSGEIRYKHALRISQLTQALPDELTVTVHDYVAGGLAHLGQLIAAYHRQSQETLDKHGMKALEALQQEIEAEGGWNLDQRVETVLTDLELPARKRLGELSGGWQRRVGLARALVSNPELLLLDEPTNHLDLVSIQWLEERIRSFAGSVLFITHDRAFLQRLATRIVDLDRGQLTSWPGDYRNFLRRKDEMLNAEELDKTRFEKKLANEEVWIRQGIKARRTRNEGRVRALEAMRQEYQQRQRFKPQQSARIHIEQSSQESGRKVIELRNVCHGFAGEPLLEGLSLKIMRGDRVGLIGNNGVGKSTLLKIMLGQLIPDSGQVKLGTQLDIAYFDQMRRDLDLDKTIAEVVGDGREYIQLNGKDRHVIGYLRGFLFSAKRAMTPIRALSGGERNRVILARLFTRPSNLLILDEPTNDLDVETLEVLEARLVEYKGTLIVVSHDREFLDNVITSTLVFEADGRIGRYPGGYSDWLRKGRRLAEKENPVPVGAPAGAGEEVVRATAKKKLGFNEQQELKRLPAEIDELEQALARLQEQVNDAGFYSQSYEVVEAVLAEHADKQAELDRCYERWGELEG